MIFNKAGKYKPFYEVRPTDAFKLAKGHFNGRYMTIRMNKAKFLLSVPISNAIMTTLKVILEFCKDDSFLPFNQIVKSRIVLRLCNPTSLLILSVRIISTCIPSVILMLTIC